MKVLIDNGHGYDTAGKCSPDHSLEEWQWTREIAARVVAELKNKGVDASLLTPEINDVPLSERVGRVNKQCSLHGAKNVVVVSIHNNAAPPVDGKWHSAQGWSVFVSTNKQGKVSNGSQLLSGLLAEEASKIGRKVRKPLPNQPYWVKSLAITRDTLCPAALTENYFMDNEVDIDFLLSDRGKAECVRIHVDAIIRYIELV